MSAYAKLEKQEPEKAIAAPNQTGIPDNMKTHFENLSGFSFDDVCVHYNSAKPAQLQALAYTQGNQVYVAPGQEKHLGHELGHVVQQKQGQVTPTTTISGAAVNDDPTLENAADTMQFRKVSDSGGTTTNNDVIQRVKAYRVGTSKSKYKITVEGGRIVNFNGGSSGIDISFNSDDHARYYFQTKKSDSGAELVEWEFPDELYDAILLKLNEYYPKVDLDKVKKANRFWEMIKRLPAPSNSSDKAVRDGNLIAPHFPLDWIPILNTYGKGTDARITTHEEFFGSEHVEVVEVKYKDTDLVYVYNDDGGFDCSYKDYKESYQTEGYSFRDSE